MPRPHLPGSYDEVFVDSESSEPDDEADEDYEPFPKTKSLRRSSRPQIKPTAKGRKSTGQDLMRDDPGEITREPKHTQEKGFPVDKHPSSSQAASGLFSQTYLESILRQARKGEVYPARSPALQLNAAANYGVYGEAVGHLDAYDRRPSLQISTNEPIVRSAPSSSMPSTLNPECMDLLLHNPSLHASHTPHSTYVPVQQSMEASWGQAWPDLGAQPAGTHNSLNAASAAESMKRLTSLPSRSLFQSSKKAKEDTDLPRSFQSGGVNPNDLKLPSGPGSSPVDAPGSTGSRNDNSGISDSQACMSSVFFGQHPSSAEESFQKPRLSLPLLSRDPSSETTVTQSDGDAFDDQRRQQFAFYNSSASLLQSSQLQHALLSKPLDPLSSATSANFAFDIRPSTANSHASFGPSEVSALAGPESATSPMTTMPTHDGASQHYRPYGAFSQPMPGRPATSHGPYMVPSFGHQINTFAPSLAVPLPSWMQPQVQPYAQHAHMSRPQTSRPHSSAVNSLNWRQRLGKRRSQTLDLEYTATPGSGGYPDVCGTPTVFRIPSPNGERRMSYPGFGGAKYRQGLGWEQDMATNFMSSTSAPSQIPRPFAGTRSQSPGQHVKKFHPPAFATPAPPEERYRQSSHYPSFSQPSIQTKQNQPRSISFSHPDGPTISQLDNRRRSVGSGPTPKSALARAVIYNEPEGTEAEGAVSETEVEAEGSGDEQHDDADYEEFPGNVSSSSEEEPLRLLSRASQASQPKIKPKAASNVPKRSRRPKSRSKPRSKSVSYAESRTRPPGGRSDSNGQMVCACPLVHVARPSDGENAESHLCTTKVTANRLLVQGHKMCSYCIGRDGHVEEYVMERIRTKTIDRLCYIYVIYRERKVDQAHGDGERWQKYWEHHRRERVDEKYGRKMLASWLKRMETEKRNWEQHEEKEAAGKKEAQATKPAEVTPAVTTKAIAESPVKGLKKGSKATAKSRSVSPSLEPNPVDFENIPEPESASDNESTSFFDDWAPNPYTHSSASLALPKRPIKRGQIKPSARTALLTNRSASTPDPRSKKYPAALDDLLNFSSPELDILANPSRDSLRSLRSAAGFAGASDLSGADGWDGRVTLSLTPPLAKEIGESKNARDWDLDEAVWTALSSSPAE
ncbi:hypothetical protein IAR50_005428 [Cryptococcus sp. DSM 104548]